MNEEPEFKAENPDGYDENGTGPVATFAAVDPEGADVEWSLEGHGDEAFFAIDANGVLTFKKSPDYETALDTERDAVTENLEAVPPVIGVVAESPMDNDYVLTVVVTEVRAADAEGETKSSTQEITVTVRNVEEAGSIDLSRLQPQTTE